MRNAAEGLGVEVEDPVYVEVNSKAIKALGSKGYVEAFKDYNIPLGDCILIVVIIPHETYY